MLASPEFGRTIERFRPLLDHFLSHRSPLYIVGGAVRDGLLPGRPPAQDLDLALTGPVLPLTRRVADAIGWAFYPLDEKRDVARLVGVGEDADLVCDVAALRGDVESDLRARDFTINALAVEIDGKGLARMIDPTGGLFDLEVGLLRAIHDDNLVADPLRLLRAARLSLQLGYGIEASTFASIQNHAEMISQCSGERIRDELWKLLLTPDARRSMNLLAELRLLPHLLPEIHVTLGVEQSEPHWEDVYNHSLSSAIRAQQLVAWIEGAKAAIPPLLAEALTPVRVQLRSHLAQQLSADRTRGEWLVWHALLHDVGKTAVARQEGDRIRFFDHEKVGAKLVKERLHSLRFSSNEIGLATQIIRHHMHPHHLDAAFPSKSISKRAVYRFFRKTRLSSEPSETGIDILLLAMADRMALKPSDKCIPLTWISHYANLIEAGLSFAHRPAETLVDGNALIQRLQLSPGPIIGEILESVREAQAVGEIETREEALALAARMAGSERQS